MTNSKCNYNDRNTIHIVITGPGGGLGLWATTLEILHGGNLNAGRLSISLRIASPLEGLDAQNERKGPAAAQS